MLTDIRTNTVIVLTDIRRDAKKETKKVGNKKKIYMARIVKKAARRAGQR